VPIRRFAKVVLLAPAIGSALIGVLGLFLGVILLLGRDHFGQRTAAHAGQPSAPAAKLQQGLVASSHPATIQNSAVPIPTRIDAVSDSRHETVLRSTNAPPETATLHTRRVREPLFQKPVSSADLEFLNESPGQPLDDLVRRRSLRTLVDQVVPYVPFHFGLDMPLPNALEGLLSGSASRVQIRDGRYAMMTGLRGPNTRGRAFLWVDTQKRVALGGIFFYPSNGEPTPTLTIFSKQVSRSGLRMSELPKAFFTDLSRWAAAEGVPPVTTRYFINASSDKTVLMHDEDFCKTSDGRSGIRKEDCTRMHSDAKEIDRKAAEFLSQTHNATNATMRMVADVSQVRGRITP
jgi:hypothetical protein